VQAPVRRHARLRRFLSAGGGGESPAALGEAISYLDSVQPGREVRGRERRDHRELEKVFNLTRARDKKKGLDPSRVAGHYFDKENALRANGFTRQKRN